MKKIGSKVLLMMVLFVVIFGLNTITSVRSQNRVKRSGLEITEQLIFEGNCWFPLSKRHPYIPSFP